MLKKFCLAALAALITVLPANADTIRNGFSVERLGRVDALLDQYVNEGRVAGVVALVLRDGKPVYQHVVGWADKEAGPQDGHGHGVPHCLAEQGAHQRRHPAAHGARQAHGERSRRQVDSELREDHGQHEE